MTDATSVKKKKRQGSPTLCCQRDVSLFFNFTNEKIGVFGSFVLAESTNKTNYFMALRGFEWVN